MRKEYAVKNATFVYSKNELSYTPLLEEMKQAKEVTIITYNISETQQQLLNCLKSAPDDCEISIITNIPGRWEEYYGHEYRARAHQRIQVYMTKLRPEKLGEKASVYFNFDNHGKIIMTDSSIYIGSSNFSEESAQNIEFGVIVWDTNFLSHIKQELLPDIKAQSIPYYEYDYTELLLESNMLMAAFFNAHNELTDEIYLSEDDWRGDRKYFNDKYDLLSSFSLSKLESVANDCLGAASEMIDALEEICGNDSQEYDDAYQLLGHLQSVFVKLEALISDDSIAELADFNEQCYIQQLLERDYAMEADEENLEHYVRLASNRASSELYELCEAAHQDLDFLLEQSNLFYTLLGQIISFFSNQQLKKVSSNIDNTLLKS